MTTPAFDVVLAAVRHLEARPFVVSTGSTTTSVTDGSFASLSQSNDQYKGGLLIAKTLGASSNQLTNVTATTSAAYTVSPAVGSAPTSGDMAYVLGPNFPASVILAKLAELMLEYTQSTTVNTSLVTVVGQREYTIPTILTGRRDVVEVEVEDPYTTPTVYTLDTGARVDLERGLIVFNYDPIYAGLDIRLRLRDTIPVNITPAALANTTIAANIDPHWFALELAARCAAWRLMQAGSDSERVTQQVNDLRARALAAKHRSAPVARAYAPILPFRNVW